MPSIHVSEAAWEELKARARAERRSVAGVIDVWLGVSGGGTEEARAEAPSGAVGRGERPKTPKGGRVFARCPKCGCSEVKHRAGDGTRCEEHVTCRWAEVPEAG